MRIEFSFDDGHPSDVRAANLLSKYGFVGTFYWPGSNGSMPVMSPEEVKRFIVDAGHEVGGHTTTHPNDLKLLDDQTLAFEIGNNALAVGFFFNGRKLPARFCYPRGRHDERVRAAVAAAGFTEARTTIVGMTRNLSGDPLRTPTSVHMAERAEYNGVGWPRYAREMFQRALAERDDPEVFFSLWGHSWELDRDGTWDEFEALLQHIRSTLDAIGVIPNCPKSEVAG